MTLSVIDYINFLNVIEKKDTINKKQQFGEFKKYMRQIVVIRNLSTSS